MRRLRLVATITLIAAIAAACTLHFSLSPSAALAPALALVLVLPGAAFIALLGLEVGIVQRGLYVLGTSIAITILTGLVLALTPWGLTRSSLTLSLAALTAAAALPSLARRGGRQKVASGRRTIRLRPVAIGVLLLACVVVVGALALAVHAEETQRYAGFTQFDAVPLPSVPASFRVTVANREDGWRQYEMRLSSGGVTRSLGSVSLGPGQEWSCVGSAEALAQSQSGSLRLMLFVKGQEDPYRVLVLWPFSQETRAAHASPSTGASP